MKNIALRIGFFMVSMAGALSCAETWIVNQEQRKEWEALLKKADVTTEYAQTILARCAQVSIEFGIPREISKVVLPPSPPSVPEQLLWKDDEVSIYSARNPRVRHHIWVVLNRPVDRFSEVLPEEAIALRAAVNKVFRILRTHCGLPSAVIAQWNEPQPGQLAKRFTIEVIPPRAENITAHNILDKAECNGYVLFRGQYTPSLPAPTEKEVAQDEPLWRKALESPLEPPFLKERTPNAAEPWIQIQASKNAAAQKMADWFFQILSEQGIEIERKSISSTIADEPLKTEVKACAFCLERIVSSQLIYESEFSYLLYNYKPSMPGMHFLIVPKRHVHSSDKLTEEEIQDMHELAIKLTQAFEQKMKRSDVKMYIQDGPSVGQTVAHSHMHILATPSSPLKDILFGMNYDAEKCYSREEMKPFIEWVISFFKEEKSI